MDNKWAIWTPVTAIYADKIILKQVFKKNADFSQKIAYFRLIY
jgi:hypothetical protein